MMQGIRAASLVAIAAIGCSRAAAPRPIATPAAPAVSAVSDRVAELCAGVPPAQVERPYFLAESGIAAVRELTGEQHLVKFGGAELRGAEIALRAGPDGARHRVARLLRCHLAWHDAVGFAEREPFDDPLTAGTPELSLEDTGTGLVLRIAGHDRAQGEEILRRARTLLGATAAARD
jgi:hypothetical protein